MAAELSSKLKEAKNLLVVKPSSLGDIVHTLPAVALIKAAAPELSIRWVANTEWVPLLRGNTDLVSVIPFPRAEIRGPFGFAKFLGWSRVLREPARADIAIDFQGLLRSGLMAKRSRADLRLGLSDSREGARFFHQHRIQVDPAAHAVDRYLAVPRAFGIPVPEDDADLSFKLPQQVPETSPPEGFVLLHPFSRGQDKSLGADAVKRFCEAMGDRPVVLVGRGGPELRGLPSNAHNWINSTDLAELAWLMARAQFTVSVDSGPSHMAAAVGDRLLAIHSWSDPLKVGPYRKRAWVWKAGKISRVADLEPDRARAGGVLPDLGEIEGIARHALENCGA